MAKLPTVALIGRPNTGKSRLFNRLIGRRRAIVSDTPGTTRDHIAGKIEGEEVDYLLVDTGGMGRGTADLDLADDVQKQSELALENADLILFTINTTEEMMSSDYEIVDLLRKNRKQHVPVIIVLTKCDNPARIDEILPHYYELGLTDDIIATSAAHNIGIDELENSIESQLSDSSFGKCRILNVECRNPKVAVIGKPNVGKSSIINAFMSETQKKQSPLLVSNIPGTTRDSTNTTIKYHDQEYVFTDTAGIKRRKDTKSDIEAYAYFRSIQSIEESDIAVLVLDGTQKISKQDKRIAGIAVEEGKGVIVLLNKIDLLTKEQKTDALVQIETELSFCDFAPVIPCSADTREGLLKIFDAIEMVHKSRTRRIATKDLLNWFKDTVYGQPMAVLSKAKHITQADELPPTFVIFVNDPKKVQPSQLRYLDNQIRKSFGFEGTPVHWITKMR